MAKNKTIETEINVVDFVNSYANNDQKKIDNQTKVYVSNAGTLKYPLNIMIPMFEKMFAKQMEISLGTLKDILEN